MIAQVLPCPFCQGTDMVRHGTTPQGQHRDRCRQCLERGRTFLGTLLLDSGGLCDE
jgi:InsA-like protein